MKLLWCRTTTKVLGDRHTHNEDIYLPKTKMDVPRFVMCDGATSSYAARMWAEILAAQYMISGEMSDRDRVYTAAKQYETKYPISLLAGMNHSEIEAFKRGSSTTLLLLEQDVANPSLVHVTTVGDTCVFVLDHDGHVIRSFPFECAEQFSTSAYLVTVTFDGLRQLFDELTMDFYWKKTDLDLTEMGNVFLLCATDAVSQWIMSKRERPDEIRRFFKAVKSRKRNKFVHFIEHERRLRTMPTDDSTVVIIGL